MSLLAEQLKLRHAVLKNRIAMPPMANNLATEEGAVTPELNTHYEQRARNAVSLVIVEHAYVHPSGRVNPKQLGIHRDELVEGLAGLATAIRRHGSLAVIQITHAGSNTTEEACGQAPIGPSAVPHPKKGTVPREMSEDELFELRTWYVDAALRAQQAGFDAVELHGAHGYGLNQFLSPLTNRRTDSYGGSEHDRARFPLEVVRALRTAMDERTLLMYRLGVDDLMDGGLTIEATRGFAVSLEEHGIDLIDVSGGMSAFLIVDKKPGYFRMHSHTIKALVKTPVMVTGGIDTPESAEETLRKQDADVIGVGRALLSNPRWATEALQKLAEQERTHGR